MTHVAYVVTHTHTHTQIFIVFMYVRVRSRVHGTMKPRVGNSTFSQLMLLLLLLGARAKMELGWHAMHAMFACIWVISLPNTLGTPRSRTAAPPPLLCDVECGVLVLFAMLWIYSIVYTASSPIFRVYARMPPCAYSTAN